MKTPVSPLMAATFLFLASCQSHTVERSLTVSHQSCEGLEAPAAVDTGEPRFSWRIHASERGVRQTAWQLRVTEVFASGAVAASMESTRVESDQSHWVTMAGFTPKPRTTYRWQVRVWDNLGRDSGWSAPAVFDTGLMGAQWPAAWIGDGIDVPKDAAPPARYFRREFELRAAPARAWLYVSAFGLVEPWLNGRKVTEDLFSPGWPDYRRRVFYVAYDVTSLLQAGGNTVGLILGDGWYSGTMLRTNQYGPQPKVSAFLEVTDASGATTTLSTDGEWRWANGPITENSIYHGETFDARKDSDDWCQPVGCAWDWKPVQVHPPAAVPVIARISPLVRRQEELKPVSRREVRPGVWQYDLGQNMVGWVRLKISAAAGSEITVRFAEMLEADGSLHTANLRTARATARYIARGGPVETWEPRFTFFGFRYVEVSGIDSPPDDAVTGVVLHSDLERIGSFECSEPLLNQLFANTLWGQKGNFLEVPTDCPQRDERLGWTGDAQVFCDTANYNLSSGNFYRQWLWSVQDSYREGEDGGFADVAPDTGFNVGSAGWGDAGVIVPWVTWLHTGDRRVLEEAFDSVQKWIAYQETQAPDGIRRSRKSYGDWLAPGYPANAAPTPYVLIATAYFARTTQLAAQMADVLGKPEIAASNRALWQRIREAFRREFIAEDGRIESDEQTAYLLALAFDLAPAELRPQMVAHLERTVAAKDNHLATGFLGTPLLAPVLSRVGRTDLAYTVVKQESYPGWLFSIKNGATTIWERWDSWTPEGGFNKDGMNSFNHYAYGSVVEWLYDTVAGLRPDGAAPGWKRFRIAPQPGGGLNHAKASVETPYGTAAAEWTISGGELTLVARVPVNTEAAVRLPVAKADTVREGGRSLAQLVEASGVAVQDGGVEFSLRPGEYRFSMPWSE